MPKTKLSKPRRLPSITEEEIIPFITGKYDDFEARGISNREALDEVEARIFELESELTKTELLRVDMSSKMAKNEQAFDRKIHTHNLAEFMF